MDCLVKEVIDLNTEEIMKLALQLAGMEKIPADSAIHIEGENIRKILFCIDAGVSELLLAKQLGCDAVIAHHPPGGVSAINFPEAFKRHVELMIAAGIPREVAEKAVRRKFSQLEVEAHRKNYAQIIDAARALEIPFMNIHMPLDEIGRQRMDKKIREKTREDSKVEEVVSALMEFSEFRNALTEIKVWLGKPENLRGKIVVAHGAGTNGGYEIAKTYFEHGIDTLIYIHINPTDLERLKAEFGDEKNLIVTGHIASDSLGINPLIHELEKREISVKRLGIILG